MKDAAGKQSFYYPLFEHMSQEHGLTLLDSEMEEILQIAKKLYWSRPIVELEGSYPVVLYFDNDGARKDFIKLVHEARPGMRSQAL